VSDSAWGAPHGARAGWGPALRAARQARHVSLRGLQALVSYDFTYLGQVERGEKPGSREVAARCDAALETGGTLTAAYEASVEAVTGGDELTIMSSDGLAIVPVGANVIRIRWEDR